MEKRKNKVFFFVFAAFWVALILWNFLTPVKTFSEQENRTLASWPDFSVPDLLDGDYMDGVNTFFNDQFAGKDMWISMQSLMEYGLGKRENNGVYIGKGALLGALPKADKEITEANIAGVNAFAAQYGIPTYIMLVPGSASVQPENLPAFADPWDEEGYIEGVNGRFAAGVTAVPVFNTLRSHSGEYIYYRTDHHWTTYGAWLAYGQLAAQMGLPALQQQDFEITTLSTNFLGTYNSKTGFPLVEKDTIELYQNGTATSYEVFNGLATQEYSSIYFEEFLSQKDKYSYFLGQVQPYVTIHTAATTGKKLILFKDSYAHCLTPMLLNSYSEIRLVDLRYLSLANVGEFLGAENYDEALFLYSADVFAHQETAAKLA
ncbi:MAG: DHHW family protein [Oscillospiraceae bacterium]